MLALCFCPRGLCTGPGMLLSLLFTAGLSGGIFLKLMFWSSGPSFLTTLFLFCYSTELGVIRCTLLWVKVSWHLLAVDEKPSVLVSFLLLWWNILTKNNLENKGVYFSSQFQITVLHCGEVTAGTLHGQSHPVSWEENWISIFICMLVCAQFDYSYRSGSAA